MSDDYRYSERRSGRERNGESQLARREDVRDDDFRGRPRRRRALSDLYHPTEDERNSAMLCHLLAIFLHFIGPIIIWATKKDESKFVDWHGREALNFSINMMIYNLVGAAILTVFAMVTCGFGALAFPLLLIVPIYSLVMHIIALNSAKRGELYRYPMIFRIIGPPDGTETVAEQFRPQPAAYSQPLAYPDQYAAPDYQSAPAHSGGGSMVWIWITAIVCVLLLFTCFGGIGVFFLLRNSGSTPFTTKKLKAEVGDFGPAIGDVPAQVPKVGGNQQPGFGQPIPPLPNRPQKADPVEQALDDMKDPDQFTRGRAADALARLQPNHARRSDVARALENLLRDPEQYPRDAAARAIAVWATKDQVPALLDLLRSARFGEKNKIIALLGELKDDRAVIPLVEALRDTPARKAAADALKNFGAKAEDDVIPLLQDRNTSVKRSALEVLKAIGTKKSIAPLEEASKDRSPTVSRAAKDALEAVKARNP